MLLRSGIVTMKPGGSHIDATASWAAAVPCRFPTHCATADSRPVLTCARPALPKRQKTGAVQILADSSNLRFIESGLFLFELLSGHALASPKLCCICNKHWYTQTGRFMESCLSVKTECFVSMNLDWVVRLALRVAIRSQRDRGYRFLRFMGSRFLTKQVIRSNAWIRPMNPEAKSGN
jgi:hypothetical protein